MQYLFIPVFLLGLCISCSANESDDTISLNTENHIFPPDSSVLDSAALGIQFTPQGNYNQVKANIKKRVQQGKSSGKDLEQYLMNEIIPFWYGTPWDFNGYTAIPNEGVIACGYFVSTTLLHAGININRYHLAQQAGLNEAKSLALSEEHYKVMYGKEKLIEYLKTCEDGLYFVGLDNHVGYLYLKQQKPYFLHSNYIENRVMIESALDAPAFQSSIYVIADITTNELLLERWRTGQIVPVVRE